MTGGVMSYSGPGPGESKDFSDNHQDHSHRPDCENELSGSQSLHYPFQPWIEWEKIGFDSTSVDTNGAQKKSPNKYIEDIQLIVDAGKLTELKSTLRKNNWLPNDKIRGKLWQVIEK